jgi:hypothetical protein
MLRNWAIGWRIIVVVGVTKHLAREEALVYVTLITGGGLDLVLVIDIK